MRRLRTIAVIVALALCVWLNAETAWLAPVAFLLPSCVCCGTPCAACSGSISDRYQVDVSGIVASGCLACSADGSYIVDGAISTSSCTGLGSPCCQKNGTTPNTINLDCSNHGNALFPLTGPCGQTTASASVTFYKTGSNYHVRVGIAGIASFDYDFGTSAPDCTTLSSLSIPPFANGGYACTGGLGTACNASGATCLLTSL